jgi:O-antigen ligase
MTLFSSPEQNVRTSEAVESTEIRTLVLKESLLYTLAHPVFGVGPGMYSAFQHADSRQQGAPRGHWMATHNTYTQLSCECGVPALVFYLIALVGCVRISSRLRHVSGFPGAEQLASAAYWLNASLITYAISSAFASMGYTFVLPALAGLTVGLERAVEAARAAAPKPAPAHSLPSLRAAAGLTSPRPVA